VPSTALFFRYSDNRYSDISKWVMQWVRVKFTVRVSVSVSCAFSEAFVGIAAVGTAACTPVDEMCLLHNSCGSAATWYGPIQLSDRYMPTESRWLIVGTGSKAIDC